MSACVMSNSSIISLKVCKSELLTLISWADTDKRHVISMKSQGFLKTPQDIMEEYNGCSVPQYTACPLQRHFDQVNWI